MTLVWATVLASAADVAVLNNGFEIRHERRELIGETTRLFLSATDDNSYIDVRTADISEFRHDDAPPAPPNSVLPQLGAPNGAQAGAALPDLHRIVTAASDKHQVDADLIASVIRAESNYNPRAVSRKGAQGLMQLMPGTATKLGVSDAFQPEANVDAGTRYLRELLLQYNGDVVKALAAYNAGPQRVEQYKGVPPYRETHAYVARIVRDFNRKKLEQWKAATMPAASKKPVLNRKRSKPPRTEVATANSSAQTQQKASDRGRGASR